MIPGVTISNGVTTIVVAPMNLRIQFDEATKDAVDIVLEGRGDDPKAYQQAAIEVILACARRNHSELTREQLYDVLDYADVRPLLLSILSKSGFKPRPLEQSRPEVASPSPAAASSDSSSTEPAGPSTTSSTA